MLPNILKVIVSAAAAAVILIKVSASSKMFSRGENCEAARQTDEHVTTTADAKPTDDIKCELEVQDASPICGGNSGTMLNGAEGFASGSGSPTHSKVRQPAAVESIGGPSSPTGENQTVLDGYSKRSETRTYCNGFASVERRKIRRIKAAQEERVAKRGSTVCANTETAKKASAWSATTPNSLPNALTSVKPPELPTTREVPKHIYHPC